MFPDKESGDNISGKGLYIMRILFAGGGTAGHINPAIAVANYIKEKETDCEVLFVGTKEGMETTLVPKQGYNIKYITIHGFERKLNFKNIKTGMEIFSSIRAAKKIIRDFKPDVVMGTGGYVTGPVLYAAHKLKIPTLVHESNAYPGVTVRILSHFVDVIALAMKEAAEFLPKGKKIEVTGNPIRPSILKCNQFEAKRVLGLDERKVVLIFGGSLGANKINMVAADWIAETAKDGRYQILMSAGKNNQYETVMERLKNNGFNVEKNGHVKIYEYIYDMDLALNAADLIIARSGSSVCEMTALGKPAVLIPSPYVAGNHQEHNARALEASGGAVVITEAELSVDVLKRTASQILDNDERLRTMSKNAKSIGICDATDKLYDILKKIMVRCKP